MFQPGVTACLGVALLLLVAAFLLIEQAGEGPGWLPQLWRAVGTAGVAIVLVLRRIGDFRYVGLFKRYRDTPFARLDTWFFTPLVLARALAGAVALIPEPPARGQMRWGLTSAWTRRGAAVGWCMFETTRPARAGSGALAAAPQVMRGR